MSPWDFPPEYGIEEGERCGRYRCSCRISYAEPECDAGDDCPDSDPESEEECGATHHGVLYCEGCGWTSDE